MILKPTRKIKLCKCGKDRQRGSSLCYSCLLKKRKEKKAELERRKRERKLNSKGYQEKSRRKLFKECWKLMSEWIRTKDADWRGYVKCFTCGYVKDYRETNAGHYIHDKLDFDERNIKVQCTRCNLRLSGNLGIYAEKLLMMYGENFLWELRKDAQEKRNNYSYEELFKIKEDLKEKLTLIK